MVKLNIFSFALCCISLHDYYFCFFQYWLSIWEYIMIPEKNGKNTNGKCYFVMFSLVTSVTGHFRRSTKTYLPLLIKGVSCTFQCSFCIVKMSSDFQCFLLFIFFLYIELPLPFFFFITAVLLISLFCKPSLL